MSASRHNAATARATSPMTRSQGLEGGQYPAAVGEPAGPQGARRRAGAASLGVAGGAAAGRRRHEGHLAGRGRAARADADRPEATAGRRQHLPISRPACRF